MASLRVRSPLRSAHPLFIVNKIVSLTAFILLLGVGWLALSFIKSGLFDRWRSGSPNSVSAAKISTTPVREAGATELKPLTAPVRLVYSCADDKTYYHSSTHLPARCERTAVSEQAAVQRGLKRCGVCLPE